MQLRGSALHLHPHPKINLECGCGGGFLSPALLPRGLISPPIFPRLLLATVLFRRAHYELWKEKGCSPRCSLWFEVASSSLAFILFSRQIEERKSEVAQQLIYGTGNTFYVSACSLLSPQRYSDSDYKSISILNSQQEFLTAGSHPLTTHVHIEKHQCIG